MRLSLGGLGPLVPIGVPLVKRAARARCSSGMRVSTALKRHPHAAAQDDSITAATLALDCLLVVCLQLLWWLLFVASMSLFRQAACSLSDACFVCALLER